MKLLDRGTVENSELVRQTFNFWLSDQGHIRCPFPGHIHGILREQATDKFYKWDDDGGSASGSAYLFLTTDGGATYAQVAKLTASDAAANDYFGLSAAIDGGAVVVGAPDNKDVGGTWAHSGAAYVFDVAAEAPLTGEFIHDGTTPDRVSHCLPADVGCVKLSFEFPRASTGSPARPSRRASR